MTTNAPHNSDRQWSTPTIVLAGRMTGPFHHLEILGYLPYALPGGNPKTGKLSPRTNITPANFGKIPSDVNWKGLYIGILKWTKRRPTTRKKAKVWQKRGDNALVRLGRIATFPDDAPALIAIDCDSETEQREHADTASCGATWTRKYWSSATARGRSF
jgi:hypothetical protein